MNIVPPSTWEQIRPYFISKFPQEAVAVVWNDGSWEALENIHSNPTQSFLISEADKLDLVDRSDEVLVLLHTHPSGHQEPSDLDSINQVAYGFPWGISVVDGNPVTNEAYDAREPECWGHRAPTSPVEGRSFLWGVRDCFTLMRDWMSVYGVQMPNPPRIRNYLMEGAPRHAADQIRHYLKEYGFTEVPLEARKHGDVITQCRGSRGNGVHDHCLVYLGEGRYLHQDYKKLSGEIHPPQEERWLMTFNSECWRAPIR